jgi:hypothetical protein
VSAGGGELRKLTDTPGMNNEDPQWSPDGRRLVFTKTRRGNSQIHVMNDDGSGQTNISRSRADDDAPAWGAGSLANTRLTTSAGCACLLEEKVACLLVTGKSHASSFGHRCRPLSRLL